jgi:tetratricopeptide (TPR) repeat protein
LADAKLTLLKAKEHTPGSGKILWGLGLASALEGNTSEASKQLEHAVELLPEWPGSYSTLGVFYFETGQIEKAREVLNRFKNSNTGGGLDINRIEQVLAQAPGTAQSPSDPLNPDERARLLQLALFLADKTL